MRDTCLKMLLVSIPVVLLSAASVKSESSNYGINTSHKYCAQALPAVYDENDVVNRSLALARTVIMSDLSSNTKDDVTIFGALYLSDLNSRWPAKRVPYFLDPSVTAKPKLSDAVRAAAKHINERTFVRLTEVLATEVEKEKNGYIRVVESSVEVKGMHRDCAATPTGYPSAADKHIGILWVGGGKEAKFCNEKNAGSIVHEFLHALGMRHEQKHHHRDAYIKILSANLEDDNAKYQWGLGKKEEKAISEAIDVGVPYDFSSIMHYHDRAFVKKSLPAKDKAFTVEAPEGTKALKEITDKEASFRVGQQDCMSELDAGTINILYASAD